MNKRIGLGMAVVVIALLAIASPVSASCPVDKSAATYDGTSLSYWHSTTSDPGTLTGQTWQIGAPGVWNNGNGGALDCNNVDQGTGSPGFLYFVGGDKIGLNLHMGTCGTGCPANGSTIAVAAYKKYGAGTDFLIATIAEGTNPNANFDYAVQGDHNLIVLPRPHVTSSSRAGTTVNLNIQVPGVSAGLYGPSAASGNGITGYNILSAQAATDPGRNASSYTLRTSLPASAGGPASGAVGVDCTNTSQDQWVVVQLQYEGGSFLANTVSQATRVNCNPALADPKEYKLIPKKQGAGSLNPPAPRSN